MENNNMFKVSFDIDIEETIMESLIDKYGDILYDTEYIEEEYIDETVKETIHDKKHNHKVHLRDEGGVVRGGSNTSKDVKPPHSNPSYKVSYDKGKSESMEFFIKDTDEIEVVGGESAKKRDPKLYKFGYEFGKKNIDNIRKLYRSRSDREANSTIDDIVKENKGFKRNANKRRGND